LADDRDSDVRQGLSECAKDVLVRGLIGAARDGLGAEELDHRGEIRRDRLQRRGPARLDDVEQSMFRGLLGDSGGHGESPRSVGPSGVAGGDAVRQQEG
jgi:hypothetical protein